jgi:hypothetical protein
VADFTTTTIWHLDAGEQGASTPSKPHGVKSLLLREPDVPGDLLRALFGNVTEPYRGLYSATAPMPSNALFCLRRAHERPSRAATPA